MNKIDYLEVRNEKELSFASLHDKSRLFVAFFIGDIRVIDNFALHHNKKNNALNDTTINQSFFKKKRS